MALFDFLSSWRAPDASGLFGHLLRDRPPLDPASTFGLAQTESPMPISAQVQPPGSLPAPTQAQGQSLDLGNRLLTGAQAFAASPGVIPAVINGGLGILTGQRFDPSGVAADAEAAATQANAQALVQQGVDPALALTITRDPQLLRKIVPQLLGPTVATARTTAHASPAASTSRREPIR